LLSRQNPNLKTEHHILVTRSLTEEQLLLAKEIGLNVTIEPAIRIQYRTDWVPIQELLNSGDKFVFAFTSQSGVSAFENFLQKGGKHSKPLKVYAVGEKTADAIANLGFQPIIANQADGVGLARKITDDFLNSPVLPGATVLHFCGNKRRDEFRQFLEETKINIRDVVVYETILERMNLKNLNVDGILFYSPSAVQAFRDSGGFTADLPAELFAIGHTTGEELSIESGKHVHISPEPKTELFLTYVSQILNESTIQKN